MPELKAWITETLAAMFSDLDPITSEDIDVTVSIATSDTSGFLLRDQYVCSYYTCHVLRLTTSFQYHTSDRTANPRRGSREDRLLGDVPWQDARVFKNTYRELALNLQASDQIDGYQSIFS